MSTHYCGPCFALALLFFFAIATFITIAGKYRKMHIPDDPAYYEKFYFTPGDIGFKPINTSVGRLGILVCWDQWYPEAARLMALQGAEILIYPTAIGYESSDSEEEQQRQRARVEPQLCLPGTPPCRPARPSSFQRLVQFKGEPHDCCTPG